MNDTRLKAYSFGTPAQWRSCVLQRFEVERDGTLLSSARFGTRPQQVTANQHVTQLALDRYGTPFWRRNQDGQARAEKLLEPARPSGPFEMDAVLARSEHWVIGREWLWVTSSDALHRYDIARFQHDLTLPCQLPIIDVASDERDGLWLLLAGADGAVLQHLDREGRRCIAPELPAEIVQPSQLGTLARGRELVLLGDGGQTLWRLNARTGRIARRLAITEISARPRMQRLASDGLQRMLLWSEDEGEAQPAWTLSILDGQGDRLDEPWSALQAPLPAALQSSPKHICIAADVIWFGTRAGLWRLDASPLSGARESDSALITPALHSPEDGTDRGFLRAETSIELPAGAVLEVQVGCASSPSQANDIACDPSLSSETKQARIWEALNTPAHLTFRFVGPSAPGVPLDVPLFEVTQPWLWLRLRLVTPPGTPAPVLRSLHVRYPDVSIVEYLPAIFRGERYDPTGFLRRFVGVLEATTQSIDRRIHAIGKLIDPDTAPVTWLNYLGRWLELPWDDALPSAAKRRLLQHSGTLLAQRGTRAGLRLLLQCLLGAEAPIRLSDLSVDFAPLRLGGDVVAGPRLPFLLAGPLPTAALLSAGARLDRVRLGQPAGVVDPLGSIAPHVRMVLGATRPEQRTLEPFLAGFLEQYLPAGVRHSIRWQTREQHSAAASGRLPQVLESNGPGTLDDDGVVGRTMLNGQHANRIDDHDVGTGYRLQ